MYNSDNPFGYEPPSSGKLLRSTLLAAAIAAVLLVTVVLPAEYGIDPTGIGAAVGLKRMGEIKVQLAEEAEADEAATVRAEAERTAAGAVVGDEPAGSARDGGLVASMTPDRGSDPEEMAAGEGWRDEVTLTLAADEAVEYKLVMEAGAVAVYSWTADGGTLNFNKHGDGSGQSVEYSKGRGAPGADGEIAAAFAGHHGWFWRNRSGNPVTLTLRTRGDYSELKRTM